MKNRVIGMVCAAILVNTQSLNAGHKHYDEKLDALSRTLLTTFVSAEDTNNEMTVFEDSCCDRSKRAGMRAPGCSCQSTAITGAGELYASGAYCLSQDITGDIISVVQRVKIDLNGHKVMGNVVLSDYSLIYDGTITGTLTVGSFTHAERLTLGELMGVHPFEYDFAHTVLVNDIFFPAAAKVSWIQIMTMDGIIANGDVTFEHVLDSVIRRSRINGSVTHGDETVQKLFFYDTTATGDLVVNYRVDLSGLGLWHSSFQNVTLTCAADGGVPIMNLQGLACKKLSLINQGFYIDMHMFKPTIVIDECVCEQLVLNRMKNVRIQNSVVNAGDVGAALEAEDCQQLTVDHVQAYSSVDMAFHIFGGKNILLKHCFGRGQNAFYIDDGEETLYNVNLLECVAKNATTGFWFGAPATTGTVIRCTADSCEKGFGAAQEAMKLIFLSNVSVANTTYDYMTNSGDAFTPSNDTLTAVSWRNIKS